MEFALINREKGRLVDQPFGEVAVSINATITKEGPMSAGNIDCGQINLLDDDFLPGLRRFGDDLSRSVGDKTLAPKLDAIATYGLLEPDTVRHRDVATVGHGVGTLDRLP